MLDARALQIIKKRVAPLTGAKPNQLRIPKVAKRWITTDDHWKNFIHSRADLCTCSIWVMPFWYTDRMRDLDRYWHSMKGRDVPMLCGCCPGILKNAGFPSSCLDDAKAMYKVCRAIVNERRGAKW